MSNSFVNPNQSWSIFFDEDYFKYSLIIYLISQFTRLLLGEFVAVISGFN